LFSLMVAASKEGLASGAIGFGGWVWAVRGKRRRRRGRILLVSGGVVMVVCSLFLQ
jgi:hypothetical protein